MLQFISFLQLYISYRFEANTLFSVHSDISYGSYRQWFLSSMVLIVNGSYHQWFLSSMVLIVNGSIFYAADGVNREYIYVFFAKVAHVTLTDDDNKLSVCLSVQLLCTASSTESFVKRMRFKLA